MVSKKEMEIQSLKDQILNLRQGPPDDKSLQFKKSTQNEILSQDSQDTNQRSKQLSSPHNQLNFDASTLWILNKESFADNQLYGQPKSNTERQNDPKQSKAKPNYMIYKNQARAQQSDVFQASPQKNQKQLPPIHQNQALPFIDSNPVSLQKQFLANQLAAQPYSNYNNSNHLMNKPVFEHSSNQNSGYQS